MKNVINRALAAEKKLFYYLALSAIVLGMASCGGEEPEVKDFRFTIEALSTKAHIVVKPDKQDTYFLSYCASKNTIEARGGVKNSAENILKESSFDFLDLLGVIVKNTDDYVYNALEAATEYVVFACYVERGEDGYSQIIGDIAFQEFKTMPKHTLNGEFTVNEQGKKVHFAQGNRRITQGGVGQVFDHQWECKSTTTDYPIDLLPWSQARAESEVTASNPFFTLSRAEWDYLFKGRANAEKLFAHATITVDDADIHGFIILPDNWETPDNIQVIPSTQMGMEWSNVWGNNWYVHPEYTFDGYAKNVYSKEQWEKLEFAGAVFLPAAGAEEDGAIDYVNHSGLYWSSTQYNGKGYYIFFRPNAFCPGWTHSNPLSNSIRNVRIVE